MVIVHGSEGELTTYTPTASGNRNPELAAEKDQPVNFTRVASHAQMSRIRIAYTNPRQDDPLCRIAGEWPYGHPNRLSVHRRQFGPAEWSRPVTVWIGGGVPGTVELLRRSLRPSGMMLIPASRTGAGNLPTRPPLKAATRPAGTRYAELTTWPARYARYQREYLGWGAFALDGPLIQPAASFPAVPAPPVTRISRKNLATPHYNACLTAAACTLS